MRESGVFNRLRTVSGRMDSGERHVWDKNRCVLAAVLASVLYAAAVTAVFSWVYQMNDDRFMKEVLSGVYNGMPDAHVIFIKYPFALLIRELYCLLPGWDWYGIVMAGINLVCLSLILYRCLRIRETWKGKCFFLVMVMAGYTAAWLLRMLAFTYTTVAAMSGATALFWYGSGSIRSEKESAGSGAVTIALALLAYLLRDSVFYMLMPFAAVLFFNRLSLIRGHGREKNGGQDAVRRQDGVSVGEESDRIKKCPQIVKQLTVPVILLLLVGLSWKLDQAAYSGQEWRRILGDGDARSVIYNYCGPADYEDHRAFYESIGVSRDTWQALVRYNLVVDEDLDTAHLYQIAEYSDEVYQAARSFAQRIGAGLKLAWEGAVQNGCKPLDQVAALMFCWALVWAAVKKDKRTFLTVLALAAAEAVLWIGLGMGGRLPKRVAESLHLCGLLSVTGVYMQAGLAALNQADAGRSDTGQSYPAYCWNGLPRGIRNKVIFCLTVVPVSLALLVSAYKWIGHTTRPALAAAKNYQIMLDYCNQHPEQFYLADVYSVVGYTDVFTLRDETEEMNYLPLGDWLAFSPMYEEKLAAKGIENLSEDILTKGNIRILCRDYYDMEYLLEYYVRHGYDAEMTVEDQIRQNGEAMDVYRFSLRRP